MRTETIEIKGKEFEVDFDYQPEEKEVRYYSDGSGYPGCSEEYSINKITFNGEDFTEFFEDDYDMIIEKLIQKKEDYKNSY